MCDLKTYFFAKIKNVTSQDLQFSNTIEKPRNSWLFFIFEEQSIHHENRVRRKTGIQQPGRIG